MMNQNNTGNNTNNNNNEQQEITRFIEACNLLNDNDNDSRKRGEKYLLEIKNRPCPYEFCLKILEISNKPHVQFHALRTICDAFLNEWYNLSIDYVDKLRSKLLSFPVNYMKKGVLSGYVLNELAKCISIMFKRKWKENDDEFNKEMIFKKLLIEIEKLLSSNDPSIAVIGLTLSNELIEEFSVNHASYALGLTYDFHIQCHRGFEQFCLQNLFILITKLFKKILSDMVIMDIDNNNNYKLNPKSKILSALKIDRSTMATHINIVSKSVFEMINMTSIVIEKCLSFNFHEKTSDDKLLLAFHRNVLINNNELLRPGPAWKSCLINCNFIKLLNIFHNILYLQCNQNKQFSSTIRIIRESVINLYSLTGHIFDTPYNNNEAPLHEEENKRESKVRFKIDTNSRLKGMDLVLNRIPFVKNCLLCLNKYMLQLMNHNNINNVDNMDSELIIDICRMFKTLCNNFRYELLIEINEFGVHNHNKYNFFSGIADFGELLIANLCDSNVWSNEGIDILLQAIVTIIHCYEIRKHNLKKQSFSILSIFTKMTQFIFIKFVEKMLANAVLEIQREEKEIEREAQFTDDDYLNERLLSIAMIGRINSDNILPYLSGKIMQIISEIKKFKINMNNNNNVIPNKQRINLSIMHEKLFWLFQFLGYTLCDDPSKEQTKIPNILMSREKEKETENNILVKSIYPLFEWISFENQCILSGEHQLLLSPFLAKTVISMLWRWSSSYLMPNVAYYEHISLGLLKSFGSEGMDGIKTLDMIIYKCYINIFKWREEPQQVVYYTCLMLESFTKHSSIMNAICKSQSFNTYILNKYYDNSLDLASLRPHNLISIFIKIILHSVIAGQEEVKNKSISFNKICMPVYNEFIRNCEPFKSAQTHFVTSEQLNSLEISIYKLHGISQTFSHFTFDFMFKKEILHILIRIICKFSSNCIDHQIVLVIFKIFADIAENSLFDLDNKQSKEFLKLCVKLIEQFEYHNLERIKQINHEFVAANTKEKYEEMQINEIMVILKLLEYMSTKDLIDISQIDATEPLLCGQCIFKSFYYLTPHITTSLLQYDFVCNRFYEVLSICIRGFTSTFANKLNNEQRNTILGNKILQSLSCAKYEIMEYGLEIIECFAEYHLDNLSSSPFLIYLQQSVHKLFMLLIDIQTPKLLYPKLCETLLPVLISIGKDKTFQYLSQFINNICKNGQQQQQKLANKFTILIEKINQLQNKQNQNPNSFILDMKTKAEFRDYFIKLTHEIRTIVSIH